tara:strand:- start:738 stop:881 length:144 start_codon:yes stop_codon:yes gene_type:complete
VDNLIARRAFVVAFEKGESAVLAVPTDGGFQVAYANSGMEKFNHVKE